MRLPVILAVFFIFTCASSTVQCQDFDLLIEKALKHVEDEMYDSAAYKFETALNLADKSPGLADTDTYISLLMYIGVACYYSVQYEMAEIYYLKAKALFETLSRTMEEGYSINLNNLAKLYVELGRYEDAEPLYKQVINIDKILVGENKHKYAVGISNLALLYYEMGRYSMAEQLCIQALHITEFSEGKSHSYYAYYLNILAQLHMAVGQYEKAEKLMIQAIEIHKNQSKEDKAVYAKYLNNLAQLYFLTKAYDSAESLYIQSIEITKNHSGEDNPTYAIVLNNLAALYIEFGDFDKAELLLNQALAINQALFGSKHPANARILNNLSILFISKGMFDQAIRVNQEVFEIYKFQIDNNTSFLTQNEFDEFLNTFLYNLDLYQSNNFTILSKDEIYQYFAFDIELMRKGIGLQSTIAIKDRILNSGDTALINRYFELRVMRKEIDKLLTISPVKRSKDPAFLEGLANELEKSINLKSKDYLKVQNENDLTWKEIAKPLNSSEVAVEFSAFKYYKHGKLSDSTLYCAIILKDEYKIPQFLFLCEEKQLKDALPSSSTKSITIDQFYNNPALYNLIWKPIDSLLQGQGINTVYFAPSGLLNSVAFSAIQCPDGKLLSEKYNLVQLSSTRTIAMPEEPVEIKDAVVFGGIKYDPDTTEWIASTSKYKKEESDMLAYNATFRGATRGGWAYLPGTKKEATQVAGKLARNHVDTNTFTGVNALEESFYSLSGNNSPSIIHISTHGFYYPDTVSDEYRKNMLSSATGDIQFKYADDPLLRSGLILAGGNNTWKGLPRPEGLEDGILTAREVSNMNLLNTELVVLSACQTGQGDVKGSEGVEGLQRGFKMAGVHYLIMSLWEVPDKETTEFMDHFYSLWPGGELSIRSAFRETQLRMMRKYPGEPSKWAGFVLME